MGGLMKLALQLYLQRDRIGFAVGLIEALIGALGMYLSYNLLGSTTMQPEWLWWLVWWAFLVGAWLVITGGLTVTKGWNDAKAEKERRLYAESLKRTP
jgi:protein-S-isoprenylcysteine O-methyltransferase Ste14